MNRGKLWLVTVLLFSVMVFSAEAQKKTSSKKPVKKTEVKKNTPTKTTTKKTPVKKTVTKTVVAEPAPDVVEDQKKIRNIVTVLEYMLNTLGSSSASARDKEVLATESYSKIFKVRIENTAKKQ